MDRIERSPRGLGAVSRRGVLAVANLLGLAGIARAQGAAPQTFEPRPPGPDTPMPLPGERRIGRNDAPIEVIEFHSLSCVVCARFHNEVFPRIRRSYIDPGLVQFRFRDYPLDPNAIAAAAFVHCAGPTRFEPMLRLLYANQRIWAASGDARPILFKVGVDLGLAPARLEACWTDPGFYEPILDSRFDAETEYQVVATPTFVIDGKVHRGMLEWEAFQELVRPLLPDGTVIAE